MYYHEPRPLIKLTKADISIQGSSTHYSTPKEYLENITNYEALEIALFDKNGNWIKPHEDSILDSYPRLEELKKLYEEGDYPVGYQVPLELVLDLKQWLT